MVAAEPRILVVIPARNEAESLPQVIDEIRRVAPDLDVLVADDGSSDSTREGLGRLDVRWLRLREPLGIGSAMRAGLRFAESLGYGIVIRLDGDGQHQPLHIARLLGPIRTGAADAVQGSRYHDDAGHRPRRARRAGHRLLGACLSALTGRRVTDPTSGFWAFGPRAVRVLGEHHPTGYPEPELLLFLHRNRFRVAEVSITMRGRLGGRSSLTLARAGHALARLLLTAAVVPFRPRVETVADD